MSGAAPTALVIVASTRAAAGAYEDKTGPVLVAGLAAWGFEVEGPVVVADGEPVAAALAGAAGSYRLIVTSGGTGLTPGDRTPEATAPLLETELPGIPELLRAEGVRKGVPTAVLSRGLAGVARGSLIINLPGSSGAVRDALSVLGDVVRHAVDQIDGGDHPREPDAGAGGPATVEPGETAARMPRIRTQHGRRDA